MADNDKNKCPLCGKDTNDGEIFCHDCKEIAENAYPEELLAYVTEESVTETLGEDSLSSDAEKSATADINISHEPDQPITLKNKNKKWYIFLVIGIALFLALGIYNGYNKKRIAKETEISYWDKCIEENTPLAYSKYLVLYPSGIFSTEAENKIRELRDTERKDWEALRNSNDVDALFAFLSDRPGTPYAREIRYAIDSLSWVKTEKDNTAASYRAYLDNVKLGNYPGVHEETAQQRYDYLSQLKTLEGKELNEVKGILTGFFKSLSSLDTKDFPKFVTDTVPRFYLSENRMPKVIIDSLKKDQKTKKIKSVDYSFTADSVNVIQDNKGIYFISLPIVENITFKDKKKKKETVEYKARIELTDKKLIYSLHK